MSVRMNIGLVGMLALAFAAQSVAGTHFRLEVGPPVAAGTDSKVKKAVLVVRPRLCDDEASVRITATAEGVVNGARQSVAVKLVALPTPGVHAVPNQWPEIGQWVLHLSGTCPATKATTSTLVPLTKTGFKREATVVLRTFASREQIEAVVRDHARSAS